MNKEKSDRKNDTMPDFQRVSYNQMSTGKKRGTEKKAAETIGVSWWNASCKCEC